MEDPKKEEKKKKGIKRDPIHKYTNQNINERSLIVKPHYICFMCKEVYYHELHKAHLLPHNAAGRDNVTWNFRSLCESCNVRILNSNEIIDFVIILCFGFEKKDIRDYKEMKYNHKHFPYFYPPVTLYIPRGYKYVKEKDGIYRVRQVDISLIDSDIEKERWNRLLKHPLLQYTEYFISEKALPKAIKEGNFRGKMLKLVLNKYKENMKERKLKQGKQQNNEDEISEENEESEDEEDNENVDYEQMKICLFDKLEKFLDQPEIRANRPQEFDRKKRKCVNVVFYIIELMKYYDPIDSNSIIAPRIISSKRELYNSFCRAINPCWNICGQKTFKGNLRGAQSTLSLIEYIKIRENNYYPTQLFLDLIKDL